MTPEQLGETNINSLLTQVTSVSHHSDTMTK